jgi:hypothetical protein
LNLILAGILLPLVTSMMLWRRPRRPRGGWVATFVLAAGMTSFSFFTIPWGYIGFPVRYLIATLFMVALLISLRRPIDEERVDDTPMRMLVKVLIALFFGNVAIGALRANAVPAGAIDLAFPLTRGPYAVIHGGSTPAANTYVGRGAESYGVDVLAKVGEPVMMPCRGTVIANKPLRVRCGEVIVEMRGVDAQRVTEKQVHVHAERNGQPVPMTFDGRWLVRNDVVRRASRPPAAARPAPG